MAKQLIIPILGATDCVFLSACADVATPTPSTRKEIRRLAKLGVLRGRRGTTGVEFHAGGPRGNETTADHLHFNVFSPRYRSEGPKTTSTVARISREVEFFKGQALRVNALARFILKASSLPERGLIRAADFEVEAGPVRIKQTGARLRLDGASIQEIQWGFGNPRKGENQAVYIEVKSQVQIDLTFDYLLKLYTPIQAAFDQFILGKQAHEIAQG